MRHPPSARPLHPTVIVSLCNEERGIDAANADLVRAPIPVLLLVPASVELLIGHVVRHPRGKLVKRKPLILLTDTFDPMILPVTTAVEISFGLEKTLRGPSKIMRSFANPAARHAELNDAAMRSGRRSAAKITQFT